jgi:hypothetical protein
VVFLWVADAVHLIRTRVVSSGLDWRDSSVWRVILSVPQTFFIQLRLRIENIWVDGLESMIVTLEWKSILQKVIIERILVAGIAICNRRTYIETPIERMN